ncbi:hypothetical protein M231_04696 [Tremella mesenterica]|uniref:Uncharacterized protein n=1 Tax=Tremella mesenterica TaxID=5217 RepID=A0A4V1M3T9_TREME|nr:hypothetical protein M231_04696 [Tremella mesenterica]
MVQLDSTHHTSILGREGYRDLGQEHTWPDYEELTIVQSYQTKGRDTGSGETPKIKPPMPVTNTDGPSPSPTLPDLLTPKIRKQPVTWDPTVSRLPPLSSPDLPSHPSDQPVIGSDDIGTKWVDGQGRLFSNVQVSTLSVLKDVPHKTGGQFTCLSCHKPIETEEQVYILSQLEEKLFPYSHPALSSPSSDVTLRTLPGGEQVEKVTYVHCRCLGRTPAGTRYLSPMGTLHSADQGRSEVTHHSRASLVLKEGSLRSIWPRERD